MQDHCKVGVVFWTKINGANVHAYDMAPHCTKKKLCVATKIPRQMNAEYTRYL